ncbi:MAG: membrane protein insertase YidC [Spartobacteria bacterium]|nr:membrane protein insertase YidC [Spartobacteria bacterium]
MKKQDLAIVVVLFALLMAWGPLYTKVIAPMLGIETQPAVVVDAEPDPELTEGETASVGDAPMVKEPGDAESLPEVAEAELVPLAAPRAPEERVTLANSDVTLTVSSYGASIVSAVLNDYKENNDTESGPVVLDFSEVPALVYENLPGLGGLSADFEVAQTDDAVVLTRKGPGGLALTRTLTFSDAYVVNVVDEFVNETTEPVALNKVTLQTGVMRRSPGDSMRGVIDLGVDSLSPGGEKVKHWGKKLAGKFKDEVKERNLPKLPVVIEMYPYEDKDVLWVAVKNKYFVQVLTPEEGGDAFTADVTREVLPEELADPAYRPKLGALEEVFATIELPLHQIPAAGTFRRETSYYIGPKKYTELARIGLHRADVMEFGMWAPISRFLLKIMNMIYTYIWPHNYGLAIILLTFMIRIVFWPVTHKSTESMKRMSEVQPLIKELKDKYKDNPQKLQQETMALYKEQKINPLGGCLPMLIQIPVFIALFVVLRSAIELRFASFLWIRDLSEPENLLAGVLPIALNILPLVMAGTMFWQQKLSPSGGDPQQQKIMAFMPLMMLVFFYKMPSGLVLYWTTNQCMMIVQQLLMKKRQAGKSAPGKAGATSGHGKK